MHGKDNTSRATYVSPEIMHLLGGHPHLLEAFKSKRKSGPIPHVSPSQPRSSKVLDKQRRELQAHNDRPEETDILDVCVNDVPRGGAESRAQSRYGPENPPPDKALRDKRLKARFPRIKRMLLFLHHRQRAMSLPASPPAYTLLKEVPKVVEENDLAKFVLVLVGPSEAAQAAQLVADERSGEHGNNDMEAGPSEAAQAAQLMRGERNVLTDLTDIHEMHKYRELTPGHYAVFMLGWIWLVVSCLVNAIVGIFCYSRDERKLEKTGLARGFFVIVLVICNCDNLKLLPMRVPTTKFWGLPVVLMLRVEKDARSLILNFQTIVPYQLFLTSFTLTWSVYLFLTAMGKHLPYMGRTQGLVVWGPPHLSALKRAGKVLEYEAEHDDSLATEAQILDDLWPGNYLAEKRDTSLDWLRSLVRASNIDDLVMIGHALGGELRLFVLDGKDFTIQHADPEAVADIIRGQVAFVLLSFCWGILIARHLCRADPVRIGGVTLMEGNAPYIVCWLGEVHEVVAKIFTEAFYQTKVEKQFGRILMPSSTKSLDLKGSRKYTPSSELSPDDFKDAFKCAVVSVTHAGYTFSSNQFYKDTGVSGVNGKRARQTGVPVLICPGEHVVVPELRADDLLQRNVDSQKMYLVSWETDDGQDRLRQIYHEVELTRKSPFPDIDKMLQKHPVLWETEECLFFSEFRRKASRDKAAFAHLPEEIVTRGLPSRAVLSLACGRKLIEDGVSCVPCWNGRVHEEAADLCSLTFEHALQGLDAHARTLTSIQMEKAFHSAVDDLRCLGFRIGELFSDEHILAFEEQGDCVAGLPLLLVESRCIQPERDDQNRLDEYKAVQQCYRDYALTPQSQHILDDFLNAELEYADESCLDRFIQSIRRVNLEEHAPFPTVRPSSSGTTAPEDANSQATGSHVDPPAQAATTSTVLRMSRSPPLSEVEFEQDNGSLVDQAAMSGGVHERTRPMECESRNFDEGSDLVVAGEAEDTGQGVFPSQGGVRTNNRPNSEKFKVDNPYQRRLSTASSRTASASGEATHDQEHSSVLPDAATSSMVLGTSRPPTPSAMEFEQANESQTSPSDLKIRIKIKIVCEESASDGEGSSDFERGALPTSSDWHAHGKSTEKASSAKGKGKENAGKEDSARRELEHRNNPQLCQLGGSCVIRVGKEIKQNVLTLALLMQDESRKLAILAERKKEFWRTHVQDDLRV
ncbi:MAG: hypothetical protein SGPRY_002310 [Prymnesium sp.]